MKKFLLPVIILFFSCSSNRYATTNRQYKRQVKQLAKEIRHTPLDATKKTWVGTTNFGLRKPDLIIIHHTAQNSCPQTLQTFTTPRTQVSAHYVICRDGTVHHMLNDLLRAWQAGISSWGNDKDVNSSSIGIELDNNGVDSFTVPQINSLLTLLDTLKTNYRIPTANFVGHADIAPTRKNDPNVTFPWKSLADRGFGIWYGDTSNITVPQNFDPLMALRIIGYSLQDPGASVIAFKRHFETVNSDSTINPADEKILYSIMLESEK